MEEWRGLIECARKARISQNNHDHKTVQSSPAERPLPNRQAQRCSLIPLICEAAAVIEKSYLKKLLNNTKF